MLRYAHGGRVGRPPAQRLRSESLAPRHGATLGAVTRPATGSYLHKQDSKNIVMKIS
jgi:hypothetical protein